MKENGVLYNLNLKQFKCHVKMFELLKYVIPQMWQLNNCR